MVESPGAIPSPKPKAISALLPYAISLDQSGDQEMNDATFHLAKISTPWRFRQHYIERYTIALLSEPAPPSLNRTTVHLSTYVPFGSWDEGMVSRWTAAVSAVPYSERVGWSVISTLLKLASSEVLRPCIPIDVWALLKKQPSLPPVCPGRDLGNVRAVIDHVRGLGDFDILKSYFLLVLSEWNALNHSNLAGMRLSITEDFGGIGMQHHRADLIKRLDHVLAELDRGLEHFRQYRPEFGEDDVQGRKERYGRLREGLLEVERKAMRTLVGMSQVIPFQQTR